MNNKLPPLNWLDKTIGWVSPDAGFRRARARLALLAYEGARKGRSAEGWTAAAGSANTEVGSSLETLRNRSRAFYRDNPNAKMGLKEITNKVIGAGGVIPQSRAANKTNRKMIDEVLKRFRDECDFEGRLDWAGQQWLGVKTQLEAGECLTRLWTLTNDEVPMRTQLLEPDHLDLAKNEPLRDGFTLQGVEHDIRGRRRAYWMLPAHPGEVMNISFAGKRGWAPVRIPSQEILHGYEMERVGQVRGVPFMSAIMSSLQDLGDYREAIRVRKKIEACFAAFVYNSGDAEGVGVAGTDDETGEPKETFEPGMIEYLNGAKDIKFADPKSNGGEGEYIRNELQTQAVGMQLPYAIWSGDWGQSNYSSSRMGMVNLQDSIEIYRWQCVIRPVELPKVRRLIDHAYLTGQIIEPDYDLEWGTPEFNLLDRETESAADNLQVSNGSLSWGQMVARMGWDPEEQLKEVKLWADRLKEAGVTLDFASRAMQTLQEKDKVAAVEAAVAKASR